MEKKRNFFFIVTVLFFAFSGCERFDHYDSPEWLQGPLYEQIKSTGEYNEYIKAVEKTGYDEFLSSRLNFTVFVPTDAAFFEYYEELGVGGVEDISTDELLNLVQYHTLLNAWDSVRMEGKTSWGYWTRDVNNFRTPSYYQPPVREENGFYVYSENTFLHLFSQPFFDLNGFNANDYESFYPESTWSGYNIDRGSIIKKEEGAENGFYYVIDRVLPVRTTADQMIDKVPEFSMFKELLDLFVRYDLSQSLSDASSEYDNLHVKSYALNFDLANERLSTSAPDGYYQVMNSVFVPSESAIVSYFNETFPAFSSIDEVPLIIIKYFLEAHMMVNKKLFPSILSKTPREVNDFADEIPYSPGNGINKQMLSSNAIIYGVDHVIHSNAFSTVSGPVISNPNYRIFTMMLELSDEISSFFRPEIGHTIMVLPDNLMEEMGFAYFEGEPTDFTDDVIFRNNDEMTLNEMRDFLESYIAITSKDVDGVKETFIKTKNDKYLRVGDNKVQGIFGEANIVNVYQATNGTVIEVDQDIISEETYTIGDYLNEHKSDFGNFFDIADKAGMLDESGNFGSISVFKGVTLLLPTDQAIIDITGTYLPEGNDPDFNFRNFIQYHVISERTIFTDDEFPEGNYGTDLFINTIRQSIKVSAANNEITITDLLNNIQVITPGVTSNIITSDGVIQIIDQAVLH
jgi:hypothetical protein